LSTPRTERHKRFRIFSNVAFAVTLSFALFAIGLAGLSAPLPGGLVSAFIFGSISVGIALRFRSNPDNDRPNWRDME
jgi:hypothetical protein